MSRARGSAAPTLPGTAAAPPRPTLDETIAATARPVPAVRGQQPFPTDAPIIGSFCTGYGGLDMAVQEVLGGSLGWVSDVDPGACTILAHHHPNVPNIGDLTVADWQQIVETFGRPYAVTGGYPCQPFSLAGELRGTDDERHLWPYIARALGVLRPRYAIFENVANHLRLGFDTVLCDLADLGFDVEWDVVRADEIGATHQRRRLIVLATATDAEVARLEGAGGRRQPAQRGGAAADAEDVGHERSGSARGRRSGPSDGRVSAADADRGGLPRVPERDRRADDAQPGRSPRMDVDRRRVQRSTVEPDCPTCGCPESSHDSGGFCAGCARCTDPELGRPGESVADAEGVGRGEGRAQPEGQQGRSHAALGGAPDWGAYAAAVARWEAVTGRRAPWPTDDRRRLNPEFVEWMMGLSKGHVTAVPGLSRAQQLKALGNGVVPQQAAAALRMLLARSRHGRHAA